MPSKVGDICVTAICLIILKCFTLCCDMKTQILCLIACIIPPHFLSKFHAATAYTQKSCIFFISFYSLYSKLCHVSLRLSLKNVEKCYNNRKTISPLIFGKKKKNLAKFF